MLHHSCPNSFSQFVMILSIPSAACAGTIWTCFSRAWLSTACIYSRACQVSSDSPNPNEQAWNYFNIFMQTQSPLHIFYALSHLPIAQCTPPAVGSRPAPTALPIPCKSTPAPTATLTLAHLATCKSRTCMAHTSVLNFPISSYAVWLLSGHRSTCSATAKEGRCTSWLSMFSNMGECRARGSAVAVWERACKACTDYMLGSAARVGRSVLAMVPTQVLCVAWHMH